MLKFVPIRFVTPVTLPPVICALPDEKFVLLNPIMFPPVITALPVEKFVITPVVVLKFVPLRFVTPVTLPPVICALAVLKLVVTTVARLDDPPTDTLLNIPRLVIYGWAAVNTLP